MLLRTTAGAYAGEIRDYSAGAAAAALRTGAAVRIEEPPSVPPVLMSQTTTRPAVPDPRRGGSGFRPVTKGHRR